MNACHPPLTAAIDHFLACLDSTRLSHVHRATPCDGWTVRDLLVHLDDSVSAFCQGAVCGAVSRDVYGDETRRPEDPVVLVERVRRRTRLIRFVWGHVGGESRTIAIETLPVPDTVVVGIASIEFAVHGWDVAQATGSRLPLPNELADELLPISEYLLPVGLRTGLFKEPLPVHGFATPADRLLAFLGRSTPGAR